MDDKEKYSKGLHNLSPLNGREVLFSSELNDFLSEGALHRYRAVIEVENLIALSESDLKQRPIISESEKAKLRSLITAENFDPSAVSEYDHFGRLGKGPFEHDVKSVEVYLRELFDNAELGNLKEFIHFPMTSEDVNNLAYNLMIKDSINLVWLPKILVLADALAGLAEKYAKTPVLGKTHGMNASPTTIGKRFGYVLDKITASLEAMRNLKLEAKFSGPVGNHNAMTAVVPEFDVEKYAKEFVEKFGLSYSPVENQRISHQAIINLFNQVQMANLICEDLAENIRHGVMMGWLYLEGNKSHVGSSVMPHKINPWFFEVGQGYLEISNSLIDGSRRGLLNSVFERDLTDHPWERIYGEMMGYSLVGISYMEQGLSMIRVDEEKCLRSLKESPEILSEAVQIAGRLSGADDIYMKIKNAVRGRAITMEDIKNISESEIKDEGLKEKVMKILPESYIGKSAELAQMASEKYKKLKTSLSNGILGVKNE